MNIALSQVRPQEPSAFVDLLNPVLPEAHRLAFAMLGDGHEAEDAVQEAALKAWKAFGRFREGSDLKPWFLTITANECRQRRRSRWWRVEKGDVPDRGSAAMGMDPAALELRRHLARLPIDMRIVLALRYYLDLSFEEMGQVLKCSAPAAKSRTHRAMTRLRIDVPEELRP